MISIDQAAAELQHKLNRNEHSFRRRPGAWKALRDLKAASRALVYRISGDRVDLLLGRRIGGVRLSGASDRATVQILVDDFYRRYEAVFGAGPTPEGSLRVERVRSAGTTVVELRQYAGGLPISDARWTWLFDRRGELTQVTGVPFSPAALNAAGRAGGMTAEQAVQVALDHESLTRDDLSARADLAIEGRTDRLVWTVRLRPRRHAAGFRKVRVDAHRRSVISSVDSREHGTVAIPVTHYSHPGGVLDSSASLTTSNINVDAAELTVAPKVPNPPPPVTVYSLERIGSGRSRIWNAKSVGADTSPVFERTVSTDRDYFTKRPDTTTDDVFNEQQTYFWAQTLKTAVDEWGREPNTYGHYPVDASRAVNVDIVVNGDASMEEAWGSGVNHGFFLDDAPGTWFRRDPEDEVPAVFLFNSAGNADSPQFFGPELSGSYSIIAHEVGHFISWQYGGFEGPSGTNLGRSLREGFSMVLAALLGKHHFGTALSYTESAFVTTGSRPQWSHVVLGQPALKYYELDCDEDSTDDAYVLAWPFVQAMWRLMNNLDAAGNPIWGSADAAVRNTADLIMYAMHCFTADSTMTWDKLCLGLTGRVYERAEEGLEQQPIADGGVYCAVVDVFNEHGLLRECRNS